MTSKQRCRKCVHKSVCVLKDYYANVEHLNEKCKRYKSISKKSCEVCSGKKFVYNEVNYDGESHYVFIEDTYFKYCPNCGRKLK